MGSWLDQELECCEFADEPIGKRFGMWMGQQSKGLGQTLACGDWAKKPAVFAKSLRFRRCWR